MPGFSSNAVKKAGPESYTIVYLSWESIILKVTAFIFIQKSQIKQY
jgi:hypothetical protein